MQALLLGIFGEYTGAGFLGASFSEEGQAALEFPG